MTAPDTVGIHSCIGAAAILGDPGAMRLWTSIEGECGLTEFAIRRKYSNCEKPETLSPSSRATLESDSPYIWFSWRDARGKQHQQSTESNDPVKAFAFRTQFMAKRKDYEKG